jgi:hypothetical protein
MGHWWNCRRVFVAGFAEDVFPTFVAGIGYDLDQMCY